MADEGTPNPASKNTRAPGGMGPLGDLVKAETMIQLAIALPAGCLIGWLLGSWLDRHFHQHWIGIAGIVLGAVAGIIQIITASARFLKRD